MCATCRIPVLASACVLGPVYSNRSDFLIWGDFIKQLLRHGCVTNIALLDLNRSDLQCFLVDPYMYFAPDAAFGTTLFAGVPFPLALGLDARAIDKEVQRAGSAAIRRAQIGHGPIQSHQPQRAFHEACALPQRQAKQDSLGQTGLHRGIT